MKKLEISEKPRRFNQLLWAVVAVLPALVAMRGIFSSNSIFYVRDLANYFYPNYLWIRHSVLNGHLPLWNPDAGSGYANIGDPSFQLFFFPTLFVRFLLPESVGFNFMVAFPFVAAAIGTFLFLKRHLEMPSAALGAIIFSISGPLLSAANSINPSTTAAMLPWLLWGTDRLIEKQKVSRFAILAVLFALAFFAGQPDMLAWAALIVTLYAGISHNNSTDNWRTISRRFFLVIGSGAVGILLSSMQFLPLLDVMGRSHRGSGRMTDGWSIHPVSIAQFFLPTLFSSPLEPITHLHPWLFQLNNGREPYLISIYLGVVALILGLFGATAGRPRRWSIFWSICFIFTFVLSLGYYTPIYKWLRDAFPLLGFFRYPSKLTIFMAFSLAALAATGFESLKSYADRMEKRRALFIPLIFAGVIVLLSAIVSVLAIGFPMRAGSLLINFAGHVGLDNSIEAISDMVYELKQNAPRLLGISLFTATLIWIGISKRKESRLAGTVLFAAVIFDLLMANGSLNPTIEINKISAPEWVATTRTHSEDRIFVDDQSPISPAPTSPDFTVYIPPDMSLSTADTEFHTIFPYNAIRYGLRDAVIVDVTKLRPQEYSQLIKVFRSNDAESRARFLQRAGVRYFLQPTPPACEARLLQPVPNFANDKFALYEARNVEPRVAILQQEEVESNIGTQFEKLFSADFDASKKILLNTSPPEPSGNSGDASSATAVITDETPTRLNVKTAVPEGGGYLLLRDSFDPNWQVEVDGLRAPLLRADGFYRAVRLKPGEHTVTFTYRSSPLFWGIVISSITAILLITFSWLWRKDKEISAEVQQFIPELEVCES